MEDDSDSDHDGDIEAAERFYDAGISYRISGDYRRSIFELSKSLSMFSAAARRSRALAQFLLADQNDLESANVLMSMGLAHVLLNESQLGIACYGAALDARNRILGPEVSLVNAWPTRVSCSPCVCRACHRRTR